MESTVGRWTLIRHDDLESSDGRLAISYLKYWHEGPQWCFIPYAFARHTDAALLTAAGIPQQTFPGWGLRRMVQAAADVLDCSSTLIRSHSYRLRIDGRPTVWIVYRVGQRWRLNVDIQNGNTLGGQPWRIHMTNSLLQQHLSGFPTRQLLLDELLTIVDSSPPVKHRDTARYNSRR